MSDVQSRTVLCDLDGTIANLSHRLHYIQQDEKDWLGFFEACVNDEPYQDIIDLLWAIYPETTIIYLSGRSALVRKETEEWLMQHDVPMGELRMRSLGDKRPDYEIKFELLQGLKPSDVWFILDDRDQVVQMWRENGFRVLQVADGKF